MQKQDLIHEFDRQIDNYLSKGIPQLAGMADSAFREIAAPLRHMLKEASYGVDIQKGTLPFALVLNSPAISAETMMAHIEKEGKKGVTALRPLTSGSFRTIVSVPLPERTVYLLIDIDRGKENINLPPRDALKKIESAGRSPSTVREGIALLIPYPEFLVKNNCFSLTASRTGTDQRVPAIWINAKKEPNLGWCWDGNPHTWLGCASCARRIG